MIKLDAQNEPCECCDLSLWNSGNGDINSKFLKNLLIFFFFFIHPQTTPRTHPARYYIGGLKRGIVSKYDLVQYFGPGATVELAKGQPFGFLTYKKANEAEIAVIERRILGNHTIKGLNIICEIRTSVKKVSIILVGKK